MGAKRLAPVGGWWPLATKWGPFGPPSWLNWSLGHYMPLLLAPVGACGLQPPNWGPASPTMVFFILIIMENPKEVSLEVFRRFDLTWLKY